MILGSTRQKLALVIGNDSYTRSTNRLENSTRNAEELGYSLEDMGFTVTMKANIVNAKELMKEVQQFCDTIEDNDLIVFYFSGHAYHFEGHNYLLSTDDSRIDSGEDVGELGTDVRRIVERLLQDKPSCIAVVILDCCRPYVLGSSTEPNRK